MNWSWSLNWGEITPKLVVGSCPMSTGDLERVAREAGASAILSLQHDDCLAYWEIDYEEMERAGDRIGLVMRRCPIRDFDPADGQRRLPLAVHLLAKLQAKGHRTYTHCTAGLGRAPLVALGYLALVEQMDPDEALLRIRAGRPGAVPSWEAYQGARLELGENLRDRIAERAHALHNEQAGTSAAADWRQAEAEVLCSALILGEAPAMCRT